jgi:hypothetical protein
MTVLGVSVYPDLRPMDEVREYLAMASKYGYTRVFSSMFSAEGSTNEVLSCFGELIESAHHFGMEVSLDVEPQFLMRVGARPDDLHVFGKIGVDILRMDGAFAEDDNVCMLGNKYGIRIEYNASSQTPHVIRRLVARGVDKDRILACHNFYPQRYTGFRWDKFQNVNAQLLPLGIRIGAFIASHAPGTHGVWDATCGLPTVERLRDFPADLQARILVAAGTTDVFFGNAYASEDELESVRQALEPVTPHYVSKEHEAIVARSSAYLGSDLDLYSQRKVRVEPLYDLLAVEKTILFEYFPHVDMGDSSEWIWRSRGPRQFFGDQSIPPRRYERSCFQRGDVVMVNDNYKHYAGEVQVVLQPIKNDGTRNLVARVSPDEMTMFDVIADGDVVVFMPVR